jgi:arylsulfatase A-like enzyme
MKRIVLKKPIWLSIGLLVSAFIYSCNTNPGKTHMHNDNRPNIIIITADDLGWSDLGCYGGDLHETPVLDKLANQSLKFTNAYAAAPVCTPTRASIMTGKYPARLHMTIWSEWAKNPQFDQRLIPPDAVGNLPHEEITLAEILKEAGYLTAHIGKWHLGDAANYPELHGFDINIGGSHWGCPPTFFYPYRGNIYNSERYVPGLETDPDGNYFTSREREYLTDRLTDEAMKIMEDAGGQPFFLNLAYYTVHTPIEGKPETVNHFLAKVNPGMHHQNAEYAAMVSSLDENIGRLIHKIDDLAITENTILIFISDNGGFIGEWNNQVVTNNFPIRSGKGSLYEGGIKIPMLIRYPGVTAPGSVCNEAVSTIDIMPTILQILDISDPDPNNESDGISIFSLVKNPDTHLNRDYLFWHYPHYYTTTSPVSSVRQGDWKLLEYFEDMHVELYNLKDDPGEINDLSEEMPDKAHELLNALNNWQKEVNAQIPVTNQNFKEN